MPSVAPFVLGGESVAPGERRTIDLPIGVMSNHTPVNLPVHVIHGRRPGPVLFVSAAVHGDEIIGVEIIRRVRDLAVAFGAPIVLTSREREGSLRMAAAEVGVDVMIFEGGEGLRFDEFAARVGTKGVLRVMRALDMIVGHSLQAPHAQPAFSARSSWLRAPAGGLLRSYRKIGDGVAKGQVIGAIGDPFGERETEVVSEFDGLLIGRTNLPVVNQGDALFHVAELRRPVATETALQELEETMQADPMFDEDEIL